MMIKLTMPNGPVYVDHGAVVAVTASFSPPGQTMTRVYVLGMEHPLYVTEGAEDVVARISAVPVATGDEGEISEIGGRWPGDWSQA